jgi:CBS domain-containing protein
MFSVHGVTGQTFRGTLEEFQRVRGLFAGKPARGIAREGEELGAEMVVAGAPEEARYRQAARAYREMLQGGVERRPVLHAYQLMSRDVLTLRPEMSVETAWHVLAERGVGQAPVLDKGHRLVGMVTTHDLLMAINIEDGRVRDVLSLGVADVMTTPVIGTDPVSEVRRVARVLLESHMPGLPVVSEQGELVGIITRSDLLRALVNDPPLSLWA